MNPAIVALKAELQRVRPGTILTEMTPGGLVPAPRQVAMLRLLGAGPLRLAALLLAEALWLATLACVLGLLLAQVLMVQGLVSPWPPSAST